MARIGTVQGLETLADVDDRDPNGYSVSVRHDAVLSDGRQVVLLDDRGWSSSRSDGIEWPRPDHTLSYRRSSIYMPVVQARQAGRSGQTPAIETVNDADGLLANFWRALQRDPDAIAESAGSGLIAKVCYLK